MSHKQSEQLRVIRAAAGKKCVTRRVLCTIFALVCLLGLSVSVFAGTTFVSGDTTRWTDMVDGVESLCFGIFPTSMCNDEQKAFLREWIASDRRALVHGKSINAFIYRFYIFDGTYTAKSAVLEGNYLKVNFSGSGSYRTLGFNYDNGSSSLTVRSADPSTVSAKSDVTFMISTASNGQSILLDDFFYTAASSLPQATIDKYYEDIDGQIALIDDSDIFGSVDMPTPSEPEPPPSIPDPPKLPDIPAGDKTYVVYNTSVWKTFMTAIRTNIGSAVVTGFIILAALLGIYVVIRVIKSFART